MERESAPDAGLCGACGLCCDGSLFDHATLDAEEPVARKRLLRIFEEKGSLAFVQPCSAHLGDRCAVYVERPKACVGYRCTLLGRYEAGEVARDEALARIAEARRHVDAVRALAGANDGDARKDLWSAVAAIAAEPDAAVEPLAWRRAHQRLLLEAAVLETYLRRHFEPELRKRGAPSSEGA